MASSRAAVFVAGGVGIDDECVVRLSLLLNEFRTAPLLINEEQTSAELVHDQWDRRMSTAAVSSVRGGVGEFMYSFSSEAAAASACRRAVSGEREESAESAAGPWDWLVAFFAISTLQVVEISLPLVVLPLDTG
jgi:predicted Rossmann-fold nucleotide-binding protein